MNKVFWLVLAGVALGGCLDMGAKVADEGADDATAGSDVATSTGDTSNPQVVEVELRNLAFMPNEVTISAGDTVRWVSRDTGTFHFVAEGLPSDSGHAFESPQLNANDTWEYTFDVPGEYIYFCPNHSVIMRDAKVIVE